MYKDNCFKLEQDLHVLRVQKGQTDEQLEKLKKRNEVVLIQEQKLDYRHLQKKYSKEQGMSPIIV